MVNSRKLKANRVRQMLTSLNSYQSFSFHDTFDFFLELRWKNISTCHKEILESQISILVFFRSQIHFKITNNCFLQTCDHQIGFASRYDYSQSKEMFLKSTAALRCENGGRNFQTHAQDSPQQHSLKIKFVPFKFAKSVE